MEEARLEALIAEFVERREEGAAESPEAFAARRAGGSPELLAALRALARTEALFPTGPGGLDGGPVDLPSAVGAYRVVGEIGRGGMGRVLRVVRASAAEGEGSEALALKLLHLSVEHDPRARERFSREAEALRRAEHPGVVRILDAGFAGDRPFLVMELVEGPSLATLLEHARRNLDPASALPGDGPLVHRAARLVARVARAVARAHEAGVLHRDLTPRNVIVREGGEPVVIDFGLVHVEGVSTLTGTGDLLGTPSYMAPEQARGEATDVRTDVFGLGGLLLELVTLRPPRESGSALETLRTAGQRPVPRLGRRLRGLPGDLAAIVARATAFRPAWRYASAGELADDLERFLAGERVRAPRWRPLQRAHELGLVHRRALVGAAAALALGGLGWALSRVPTVPAQDRARAVFDRAVVAWLDGDDAAARAHADRASELYPDLVRLDFLHAVLDGTALPAPEDPASEALVKGEEARRAGRFAEAARHFDAAWNVQPGVTLTAGLFARCALASGDHAHALDMIEWVARPLGASHFVHASLAMLYAEAGRPIDAGRAADAALRLDPADLDQALRLAWSRFELGDADGGREALAAARAIDPAGAEAALARLTVPVDGTPVALGERIARLEGAPAEAPR